MGGSLSEPPGDTVFESKSDPKRKLRWLALLPESGHGEHAGPPGCIPSQTGSAGSDGTSYRDRRHDIVSDPLQVCPTHAVTGLHRQALHDGRQMA